VTATVATTATVVTIFAPGDRVVVARPLLGTRSPRYRHVGTVKDVVPPAPDGKTRHWLVWVDFDEPLTWKGKNLGRFRLAYLATELDLS